MKDRLENYIMIEERMEKRQPTEPEPANSRPIADPLAAELWSLPASCLSFALPQYTDHLHQK